MAKLAQRPMALHLYPAAQAYDSYVQDGEGHDDVQSFFTQCAQQDAQGTEML